MTFRAKLLGTPLRADLRALATWRGEQPRVALRNYFNHPVWWTYKTHPALPYAPSPLAELDHWVDRLPEQRSPLRTDRVEHSDGPRRSGTSGALSDGRARRRAGRPHIVEVEHWCFLAGAGLRAWGQALDRRHLAEERVRAERCRRVITQSRGLVAHFQQFLAADVWPKLEYVFPACPQQPEVARPPRETFTMIAISNRLSDKGIPEALRAFEVLRQRHGPRVRMVLVSSAVPRSYRLPEGVEVEATARMTPELKARVYRRADVLVEPVYSDAMSNFSEACSYGVPAVATRIHHGEDLVRDGVSGYLVDAPLFAYSEGYGSRWRTWTDFVAEVDSLRAAGGFDGVVADVVDRLELMLQGNGHLGELRSGARRLHAERFSPEVRNAKLNQIYATTLGR